MPRVARIRSDSGIYHIVLRGINKKTIFYEDNDYERFLGALSKAKISSGCKIYCYCLMSNHIHLLVKEYTENVSTFIKRLCAGYVLWYNNKYARVGPLFQDRFKSEPVETDKYFLTVVRYIIRNPIKAGIVRKPEEYKWVSYDVFVNKSERENLIDLGYVLAYFSKDRKTAVAKFIEFINMETDDKCLEMDQTIKYTDAGLLEIVKNMRGLTHVSMLGQLPKKGRDEVIRKIKKKTGVSSRQLSRVLGISRGIVEKVK